MMLTSSHPAADRVPDLAVRDFRRNAIANGYHPVRVRSLSKQPFGKNWQLGERERLFDITPDALNSGILAAGLRCLDVDVDDPGISTLIKTEIQKRLPGALIRKRANSPRFAALVRAAKAEPGKRSIAGASGKLEVLGAGQQLLAHGVHPSGAAIEWENGRGPDTVVRDQLPAVTEDQMDELLTACAPLLGSIDAATGAAAIANVFEQPFTPSSHAMNNAEPVANELGAGIERPEWFGGLTAAEKAACVRACLDVIDNRTHDPRERWLSIIFAVAAAEQVGCTDAHDLALEWSRRGASWTGEHDFEVAWRSARTGGVSVGSLFHAAKKAGADLSPWRNLALSRLVDISELQPARSMSPVTTLIPQQQRAMHVSALALVPEKRAYLHGTDTVRGTVTLLVAPGGRSKSTWLIALGLACASGRPLLGAHVFGGPRRVLILSAEDPEAEVTRRVRAAMQHHQLNDSDVPGLYVIGADKWGLSLLRSVGNVPVPDEQGWSALDAELDQIKPDLLVADPMMSMMGGVDGNNNSAAAALMGKLVKLAADRHMAIAIAHHAAKGRDPTSQDSAMGAATFVNFARTVLTIDSLSEKDAPRIGVAPWEVKSIFRVLSVKQNFSAADAGDRWFRVVSIQLNNAQPPTYPSGDKVGVVVPFQPGATGPAYGTAVIAAALKELDVANPPLSPSKNAKGRYAVDALAPAIAPHLPGNKVSDTVAAAVLDHLMRSGLVSVQTVKVPRPGARADKRNGLVVTQLGKAALQAHAIGPPSSTVPQPPQQSRGNNAGLQDGGSPKGPRNVPRGCGGVAGEKIAGAFTAPSNNKDSRTACEASAAAFAPTASDVAASTFDSPTIVPAAENKLGKAEPAPASTGSAGPPLGRPVVDDRPPAAPLAPSNHQTTTSDDDLGIPEFLRR